MLLLLGGGGAGRDFWEALQLWHDRNDAVRLAGGLWKDRRSAQVNEIFPYGVIDALDGENLLEFGDAENTGFLNFRIQIYCFVDQIKAIRKAWLKGAGALAKANLNVTEGKCYGVDVLRFPEF